jgi:hypothetical protein
MLISNGSDAVATQISIVTSGDADFLAETLAFLQATGRQKIGIKASTPPLNADSDLIRAE